MQAEKQAARGREAAQRAAAKDARLRAEAAATTEGIAVQLSVGGRVIKCRHQHVLKSYIIRA